MFLQLLLPFLTFSGVSAIKKPSSPSAELRDWKVDRMVDCIFCLDYDDYKGFAIAGCSVSKPMTCQGNACYMRQHKKSNYFLYTTGCVNLTSEEFESINKATAEEKPVAKKRGRETQLCEVLKDHLTCVCSNKDRCNNIANSDPFSEYSTDIFNHRNFDELRHFRYFLPEDPLLDYAEELGPMPHQNVYMMRTSVLSSSSLSPATAVTLILSFSFAHLFGVFS
ncbi:hypothetical protein L596_015152 [Steinernema carpocapsae]|uniref:Uncharacterized protein n=1 Tax=Steinernema carpocapsae TaxID=34508 RepID=A0A4U5NF15_STECR|nr:hypothetical protein L596_015152 [Steinernema carpocapsae]